MKLIGLTLGAIVLAGVTTACGGDATAGTALPSSDTKVADTPVATVLKVPDGNRLVGKYQASGVQAYTCTAGAWKLLEPAASLVDKDGKPIILHSRGPVWVSTVDGSAVDATPVEGGKADRPNAIPELLLKTKTARGDGLLGDVTYVQRLNTEGGVAPGGSCQSDVQLSVPYTALYTFYAAA
ncbi:DUF3455 domain-containing protein [Umezawaea sp. Da 62-37]|uniref:DUF3455 domain-containing protein n=1 Tax=Umezawaea sp. Da 62-37 TaxID=3075927 RepID=UPI0028F70D17|nr:DUF3455 domain-containing protein [Umezawaea sp. Da 62-37]WNV91349.1 DUF3455 domain-containing protein [Umezawaea sp. Da 62-37]